MLEPPSCLLALLKGGVGTNATLPVKNMHGKKLSPTLLLAAGRAIDSKNAGGGVATHSQGHTLLDYVVNVKNAYLAKLMHIPMVWPNPAVPLPQH